MASHGVPRVSAARDHTQQSRQKELEKIQKYRSLVELVNAKVTEKQKTLEVLALTSKLLAQNPEYYTIWNYRRLIFQHQFSRTLTRAGELRAEPKSTPPNAQDLITADLKFLVPLLVQFPKCYWIWNHRIWLLQQSSLLLPEMTARRIWEDELGLVGKMLNRDSRNFHGWDYRRLVVRKLEEFLSETMKTVTTLTEQEFKYTTKMIESNLSNFSAWHNRSKLIPRLLDERGADDTARIKMLDDEFTLIQEALFTDPYDQSLWFYHRFLMSTLASNIPRSAAIVLHLTDSERLTYYEREITNFQELLEDTDDCKWIYQSLLEYTTLYLGIGGHNKTITTSEMREWLSQLRKLDPLRANRWNSLEESLNL